MNIENMREIKFEPYRMDLEQTNGFAISHIISGFDYGAVVVVNMNERTIYTAKIDYNTKDLIPIKGFDEGLLMSLMSLMPLSFEHMKDEEE